MSTSSDFSWAASNAGICSFEYPLAHSSAEAAVRSQVDAGQIAADLQKQLQRARQEGEREGELRARKVFDESLHAARQQIQRALQEFETERKSYFRRVEAEVVQLALGIARKVLHRETQLDKALLGNMVRVAIEQLADTTGLSLRVHPSAEPEWSRYLANSGLAHPVQVVGDAAIEPERCVLSTQLGSTEIGIEEQLKEIERGLFDLLTCRADSGAVS